MQIASVLKHAGYKEAQRLPYFGQGQVTTMVVNGINVTVNGISHTSEQEIASYIDCVEQKTNERVSSLDLSPAENGKIAIEYVLQPQKFERIRRITGYLVGTVDRWNDAKQAEEHERVKHGLH